MGNEKHSNQINYNDKATDDFNALLPLLGV
jgi:hypothetical protein